MTEALIGIDVGTTGVKAVAISPDGELLGVAEEGYPLSTPRPGWSEQDPEDWCRASQAALARLPEGPVGFSGQMHGLVVLGADDRVLRPAILWNDQRTGAECAEIEERIGLERLIALTGNRALPGFTAPKLLWLQRHEPETWDAIRHVLLPEGLRPLPADRRARDRRRRRVGDAAVRRRAAGAGRTRSARRSRSRPSGCPRCTSRRSSRAQATRRPARSASASTGPGRCRSCSGPPASSSRCCPSYSADAEARVHVFCHAVPGTWHAMGVMLSAAGSLAWLHDVLGADFRTLDDGGCALGARHRGAAVRAVSPGRADAARRSRRPRRVHRPVAPPRPRRARPGRARGRRLRAAGLARAAARARGRGRGRARLGRRLAQRPLAEDRRLGARPPARAHRERRGRRVRRGPAGRRAGRASSPTPAEAVARCVRTGDRIDPDPAWVAAYDEGYERFKSLYPALRPLEGA